MTFAYAARYGHQQLPMMLGRTPTPTELELFCQCLDELRHGEIPPELGGPKDE